MPKIPISPLEDAIQKALKITGKSVKTSTSSAKQAPKAVKKAVKSAAPKPVKKTAKRAVLARPSRVEKTAANIRKSYPNLPESEVMKRANMTKSQRSAYLSEQHSADSAERAATKALTRKERQEANRAAWAEKQRAKMNRFEAYKASNPTPKKKARSKKGAK